MSLTEAERNMKNEFIVGALNGAKVELLVDRHIRHNTLLLWAVDVKTGVIMATLTCDFGILPDTMIAVNNRFGDCWIEEFLIDAGIIEKKVVLYGMGHEDNQFYEIPVHSLTKEGCELVQSLVSKTNP